MSSQKFPQGTITFGATEELDDEKKLEQEVETLTPPAADDNEISQIHGAMAGIASGIIKVPEGIFSLGAELMDVAGITTDAAAKVEQLFDTINIFEETAEKTAAGKITQALVQIGVPATAAATFARKAALKALKFKKSKTIKTNYRSKYICYSFRWRSWRNFSW